MPDGDRAAKQPPPGTAEVEASRAPKRIAFRSAQFTNQAVGRGQAGFVTITEAVHPENVDVQPEELVE